MHSTSHDYLKQASEHLILEGYRSWSKGIITGDKSCWNDTWNMFATKLGAQSGRLALDALSNFTKTLRICATCPLKSSPAGCDFVCRDEVLILGLLAGIQHGDETAITLCLDELSCPNRCDEVLTSAEVLAVTLRSLDRTLMLIPAQTIKAILTDGVSTQTLH